MHTTHYKGLWSQNTGYVLRNQSHCLNNAYSSLYRYMAHYKGISSENTGYVRKPVTLTEPCMHTTHYTGLCSENTGLVLRNPSHCLNHQYSSLYRYMVSKHRLGTVKPVTLSGPCIQPIAQV